MANHVVEKKKTGINSYLNNEAVKKSIVNAIGEKNLPRFISSVVSAVQTNSKLAECSNNSILSAALLGESLQLPPSPQLGFFYMVPYSGEVQFQLGYKGYVQLAIRSGQYRKLVASEVKDGELKGFNPITEEFEIAPIMDETDRESKPVIGYYAMLELVNGFRKEIYWSKEKMLNHADRYSKAFSLNGTKGRNAKVSYADYIAGKVNADDEWKYSSFWYKDFDGMAKKTLLRQLISKWGIMSIEMQQAYSSDMGVINDDGSVRYIDNEQNVVERAAEDIEANANKEEFVEAEVVDPVPDVADDAPFV